LGEVVVVVGAEEGEVVEVGGAAVDPGGDVVPFAPFRCSVAAGELQPPSRAIRAWVWAVVAIRRVRPAVSTAPVWLRTMGMMSASAARATTSAAVSRVPSVVVP
jgi:hypothetical protein